VRRLPDDLFYHQEEIQTLILDVLFVYCKENPDANGYRQGMHELLAPLVYVLSEDAIESSSLRGAPAPEDADMIEMLDACFLEHDAYALFVKVMSRARAFYEMSSSSSAAASSGTHETGTTGDILSPLAVSSTNSAGGVEESAIVELSKEIHEGTLMKVDPELAIHLKNIEILPQIFLIRWIRLLFGREFPFKQHLILWDSMFAFDPNLHLVPLISVAMLLRVRWKRMSLSLSLWPMCHP
jgi:TBC1 domain family member 5